MCYGSGFGNCNDVTATDGPGQRNSGCRATVCCANTCKRAITQQTGAGTAERRIGHHRDAVLHAPWQQVMFNAAVSDVVKDLIGCAAIASRNLEQTFHLVDCEVGHAPGANFPRHAQTFEAPYGPGKFGVPNWPVQQVEIEMVSAEPGKARLTSTRDPISSHVIGLH